MTASPHRLTTMMPASSSDSPSPAAPASAQPEAWQAAFAVYCNGGLPQAGLSLTSLQVEAAAGAATTALLQMPAPLPVEAGSAAQAQPFVPGAQVRIDLGRGTELATVFDGRVVRQRLTVGEDGRSRLSIECRQQGVCDAPAGGDAPAVAALTLGYGSNLYAFDGSIDDAGAGPAGQARFPGTATAAVGAWIALQDLGAPFDGLHRLVRVRHLLAEGEWFTEAAFGPPPASAEQWVAPGGQRIACDASGRVLAIATPAGLSLVLSDEERSVVLRDGSGNRVELVPAGIQLSSEGDIALKARGQVRIDAGSDATLQSPTSIQLRSLDILCQASIGFKAQGSATAELSASGQTTVKGAIVMIN